MSATGRHCLLFMLSFVVVFLLPNSCCSEESYNLRGRPGDGYFVEVHIGTPPQILNVLVDTGSANLAVAAEPVASVDAYFDESLSTTFISQNRDVSVIYTQGDWKGELGSDVLAFPSLNVNAVRSDIALIRSSHNFFLNGSQWQGIFGLAYPVIAKPNEKIVTWLDSYATTNNVSVAFSLELCGGSKDVEESHVGTFRLLHADDTPHPPVLKSPIVREWFYEILLTKLDVGGEIVKLPCHELNFRRTIVDSGTTNMRLPEKVFKNVLEILRKQVGRNLSEEFYTNQKTVCLRESELHHLDLRHFFPHISLSLMESDHSYFTIELGPESYIRRVEPYCYKFMIQGSDTGTVLGTTVLQGFTVVFNRTGKSVGFFASQCGPTVTMYGPFDTKEDLKNCDYQVAAAAKSPVLGALTVVGYVVSVLMSIVAIFVVYFLIKWLWVSYLQRPDWSSLSQSNLLTQE